MHGLCMDFNTNCVQLVQLFLKDYLEILVGTKGLRLK